MEATAMSVRSNTKSLFRLERISILWQVGDDIMESVGF